MFDNDASTKTLRIIGIAAVVLIGGAVIAYKFHESHNRAEQQTAIATFNALAHEAAAAGSTLMRPVEDATLQAFQNIQNDFERKEAARRAQIAADREARTPKAYRYKDSTGAWHISDRVPPEGTPFEIIPLK